LLRRLPPETEKLSDNHLACNCSPEDALIKAEEEMQLTAAVSSLKPQDRTFFEVFEQCDFRESEVSTRLGIKISTSYLRKHRVFRRIKESIAAHLHAQREREREREREDTAENEKRPEANLTAPIKIGRTGLDKSSLCNLSKQQKKEKSQALWCICRTGIALQVCLPHSTPTPPLDATKLFTSKCRESRWIPSWPPRGRQNNEKIKFSFSERSY
jgi:hypothetical protein